MKGRLPVIRPIVPSIVAEQNEEIEKDGQKLVQMIPHYLLRVLRSSIVTALILSAIIPEFSILSFVHSCSCDAGDLRTILCRSKYAALVQVMGSNGQVTSAVRKPLTIVSIPGVRWNTRGKLLRSDGRELEEETLQGKDGDYMGHRMTVLAVISASREGEQSLKTQTMWTRTSSRPSSCRPNIQSGIRYLMFGDVSSDGRAVVSLCNLIRWESLTMTERQEIRRYKEHGLRCR